MRYSMSVGLHPTSQQGELLGLKCDEYARLCYDAARLSSEGVGDLEAALLETCQYGWEDLPYLVRVARDMACSGLTSVIGMVRRFPVQDVGLVRGDCLEVSGIPGSMALLPCDLGDLLDRLGRDKEDMWVVQDNAGVWWLRVSYH